MPRNYTNKNLILTFGDWRRAVLRFCLHLASFCDSIEVYKSKKHYVKENHKVILDRLKYLHVAKHDPRWRDKPIKTRDFDKRKDPNETVKECTCPSPKFKNA